MIFSHIKLYLLLTGSILFSHPVHVSVTNLDYKPDENKMEISIKVFKKDLQLLFVHLNQIKINFDDPESVNENQKRIDTYFSSHFKIRSSLEFFLIFKDSKLDNEWIWFYYDVKLDKPIKEIEIENTILLDLYFDQKNMLILSMGEKEEGYIFNLKETKQKIDLDDI